MHRYFLGVDLGSTTSKAIIVDEEGKITGRGITNTRANYSVAAEIAKMEAIYNARFYILKKNLETDLSWKSEYHQFIRDIENVFQYLQFKIRLDELNKLLLSNAGSYFQIKVRSSLLQHLMQILPSL